MSINNISIIGLGLIGGSIAKAIRLKNNNIEIKAFDRIEVCKKAFDEGVIDYYYDDLSQIIDVDIIFICLPIEKSIEVFQSIIPQLNENQIVTDVCSVKGIFQEIWNSAKTKGFYIGGHPMTGKEKGGFANSDSLLFENTLYILNEVALENEKAKELVSLIDNLGARISYLDPFEHDKIVANVSHLPQLMSIALMETIDDSKEKYLNYAAGGFRDMTRIASSPFDIWQSIIQNNKTQIINAIDEYIEKLNSIKENIIYSDFEELNKLFIVSSEKREKVPLIRKGFNSNLVSICTFVKDRPGELNKVISLISKHNINLKDIELLNIREGNGGVFKLSFDNEDDALATVKLLKNDFYEVE